MGFGKMTGSREERRVLYWWESGCGRCFSSTAISSFNSVTFSCSFTCIIHVHVRTCKYIHVHVRTCKYMYIVVAVPMSPARANAAPVWALQLICWISDIYVMKCT